MSKEGLMKARGSLEAIMRQAAKLGLKLFSQPSTFAYLWDDRAGTGKNSLVVFPGLSLVADENGRVLSSPKRLTEDDSVRVL